MSAADFQPLTYSQKQRAIERKTHKIIKRTDNSFCNENDQELQELQEVMQIGVKRSSKQTARTKELIEKTSPAAQDDDKGDKGGIIAN